MFFSKLKFLYCFAIALATYVDSATAMTCSTVLKEAPLRYGHITLHHPNSNLHSFKIQTGELIHGTSVQVLTKALTNGAMNGRAAVQFSAAMGRYGQYDFTSDTRLVYAFMARPPSTKSIEMKKSRPNYILSPEKELRSSMIYAQNAALSHSFADLLGADWSTLDLLLTNDLTEMREGYSSFEGLIDFYSKGEFKDITRSAKLEKILANRTDEQIDALLEAAESYSGVVVVFKKEASEQLLVVPDPETESERGVIIASTSGVSLDVVDRLYPLSWSDYHLLKKALDDNRSPL